MELRTVRDLLKANENALQTAKGHNKRTIQFVIAMLERMPQAKKISVRNNVKTVVNAGDVAEIYAGLVLGFLKKSKVALDSSDLPTIYKNEIKACYSNNRPSNSIEDKGHYMVSYENNDIQVNWVNRSLVREFKDLLVKKKRGGRTYAKAVLNALS